MFTNENGEKIMLNHDESDFQKDLSLTFKKQTFYDGKIQSHGSIAFKCHNKDKWLLIELPSKVAFRYVCQSLGCLEELAVWHI